MPNIATDGFGSIFRRGETPSSPTGGGFGSGGGGSNIFVYREAEPSPGGNVYATWEGAYNAAIATGAPCTIVVDGTHGSCQIPQDFGNVDLHQITLAGLGGGVAGPNSMLTVNPGVTWNQGFYRITAGLWVVCTTAPGAALGTLGDGIHYMYVDDDAMLASNNTSEATFDISQGFVQVYLNVDTGFIIASSGSAPFFFFGSNSNATVNVNMDGASYYDSNLVAGSAGTVNINYRTANLAYNSNLPDLNSFGGTVNVLPFALGVLVTPFTAGQPPSSFKGSVPIVVGATYFDTVQGKPYWWNGSAWVDASGSPRSS